MSSWTIVTSPVDDLLVRTDGSAITGIDFEPHRPVTGERDDTHPLLVASSRSTSPVTAASSTCRCDRPVLRSNSGSGPPCARCRSATP